MSISFRRSVAVVKATTHVHSSLKFVCTRFRFLVFVSPLNIKENLREVLNISYTRYLYWFLFFLNSILFFFHSTAFNEILRSFSFLLLIVSSERGFFFYFILFLTLWKIGYLIFMIYFKKHGFACLEARNSKENIEDGIN